MNLTKYFTYAKEKGFSDIEFKTQRKSKLSIQVFHSKVEQYQVKNNMNMMKCMLFSLLIALIVFIPGILLSRAGYSGAISLASSAFVSLLAVLFAYSRAR